MWKLSMIFSPEKLLPANIYTVTDWRRQENMKMQIKTNVI